jgi:hypothetical protein
MQRSKHPAPAADATLHSLAAAPHSRFRARELHGAACMDLINPNICKLRLLTLTAGTGSITETERVAWSY